MASTKGIAVTMAVLIGVVVASFLVYLIPEDTKMKIIVSDFEKHLDANKEKVSMEVTGIDSSFKKLMENELSPDQYIMIAETSSSQINSLVIELTNSGATQEWTESYVNYIGALKKLNEKITETIVVANLIKNEKNFPCCEKNYNNIHQLEIEFQELVTKSNNTRP